MPFPRDSSSTSRRPQGRARPDTFAASTRTRDADGVLVLYADGGEPSSRPAPKDPMSEAALLIQLRTERDAALEEVAYLKEQLCSVSAYHGHLLDEARQRMFEERTQLTTELASLREELQRRTYPGAMANWRAGRPLATVSDGDGAGTR